MKFLKFVKNFGRNFFNCLISIYFIKRFLISDILFGLSKLDKLPVFILININTEPLILTYFDSLDRKFFII